MRRTWQKLGIQPMTKPSNRKLQPAKPRSIAAAINHFATLVLAGTGETPQIGLGPVVWNIKPGHDTRFWYFVACSIKANATFRIDQFAVSDDDCQLAKECRANLLANLATRQRPSLLIDFDDELALAEWAEALCPGDRSRRIREGLQRERTDVPHP